MRFSYPTTMSFVELYKTQRSQLFRHIREANVAFKVSLAFLFACLTGASALLRFYVPFTPVPFTLQVLVVLLSGALLGKYYGGLSQVLYDSLGVVGIPWFTSPAALTGITGGYIIGFVMAAVAVGWLTEKKALQRFPHSLVPALIGLALIYVCGALQFSLLMHTGLTETLLLAVAPFVVLDMVKAAAAAGIMAVLLPGATQ